MKLKLSLAVIPFFLTACGDGAPSDADISEAFKNAVSQAQKQWASNPFTQGLIGDASAGSEVHYGVSNSTCNQNGDIYDCTFKFTVHQGENSPAIVPEQVMHAVFVKRDGKWTIRDS